MRKWVPCAGGTADNLAEVCDTVYQVVVLVGWPQHVLGLVHDHLWLGHLGITKTYNYVLKHFFWPGMKADVAHYCKTCSTCQIIDKPNQAVPPAPLHPGTAVGEPFDHVVVDCVGPLAWTKSGNQFLLTVMLVWVSHISTRPRCSRG